MYRIRNLSSAEITLDDKTKIVPRGEVTVLVRPYDLDALIARGVVQVTDLGGQSGVSYTVENISGIDLTFEFGILRKDQTAYVPELTQGLNGAYSRGQVRITPVGATLVIDTLLSSSTVDALSANQGRVLNSADVMSGAVVGNNLILSLKGGSTVSVDVTSLLADIKLSSASYDPLTKDLTLTLSDATTIVVPVDDLFQTAAVLVSPASTDAAGVVGTSSSYARQDHKHPAQGVSANALNSLTVGTDGLHFFNQTANAATLVSPAANGPTGLAGASTRYAREDHKHPAQTISADAGNELILGTDGLHFFQENEVVQSLVALTGAAPVGAKWGIDTVLGAVYFVQGGNWTPLPIIDRKMTVSQQTGSNAGVAPLAAPAAPETGDVHLELYDDQLTWWSWDGTVWAIAGTTPTNPLPATLVSPAATDAIGLIGVATKFAREDHKHPAQAVSAVARNKLKVDVTDGLHAFVGSERLFVSNTLVAPVTPGYPLTSEILAAVPALTSRDILVIYTGTDLDTDEPTHIYHIDASDAVTVLKKPVLSTTAAILINSSAGAHVETLPPATGSGVVMFFANEVVTNVATLIPAAGEKLNGTTDGFFLFSNYSAGAQFIATDFATGQWTVDNITNSTAFATAQNAAQASANAAAASFDSFDDRYLGAKNVAPTVDNDGNALLVGAKYFNSTENKMYVRNSSNVWQLDTADSSTVNYLPTGTGAVATTVQSRLRFHDSLVVSVTDPRFGATGNGIDDDRPAVTLALAEMVAGDTLFFPPGIYNMKTPQTGDTAIVLPVGVNMYMEAGAWLISTQGIYNPATGGSFISPLGNNAIVCNIDGGGYPLSGGVIGTWATWANAGIRGYVGIFTGLGAENVSIHGSEIKNVTYPIQIYGAKNWRVYDNRIHRYKLSGILAGFYAGYDCKYNQISGNSFEDGGDYAVAFFQVGGQAAGVGAYNIVSNNIAKNMNQRTNGYAFGVEAGNPDNQYGFVFSGNIYETTVTTGSVTSGGITIATTSDSIVIGNKLRGSLGSNGDTGINAVSASGQKARRGLIANNHVEGFRSNGISVDGHDAVTVRGNVVKNCGDTVTNRPAILVAYSDSSTGQVIENNTLIIESTYPHYGAGTPAIGCTVASGKTVSNVTIRGNTIINPNDYGIQVSGLSGNLVRGVTISNNSIIGTNDATFFARNPFYCTFMTGFSISGNTVVDAKRGFVAQNSTFGTIGENEVRGSNTVNAVWDITGSTNVLLRNNEVNTPYTAILATASALTTPANNNRAVGGSGLVVRNKGVSGLIASGATISHGLSVTPTNVSVTPADTGVTDFYVTAIGGSTFQVVYGGGGTHTFYWTAEF